MAEIQKKCAEKQLKIRTGNWFLPGLMIVLGGLLAGDRIALIGYKAQDGEMMAQRIK